MMIPMMDMTMWPDKEMIRAAETGSHLNEYHPTDEMERKFLIDRFDATIKHQENEGHFLHAAFLRDEKKRYQDDTYPDVVHSGEYIMSKQTKE